MARKTPEEIKAERIKLSHLKKYIPTLDRYRINQHKLMDAAIQTLKWDFTMVDIKRNWPTLTNGDEQGAAEDALYWKNTGKIPAPSECWELQAAKNQNYPKK